MYELRLPLAPYRFVWRDEPAVDAAKEATDSYTQERYRHADGTITIIREYRADGSFHILSDRGEIELIDNAGNPYAPDPVSVVRLPLSGIFVVGGAGAFGVLARQQLGAVLVVRLDRGDELGVLGP
jgi:hypothetical protein